MKNQESYQTKLIVITNQLTGVAVQTKINIAYITQTRELNIGQALCQINSKFANISQSHIFYLDFQRKMNVHIGQFPFSQQLLLKCQLFLDNRIQIRYRKIAASKIQSHQQTTQKRRKVKERSIKEAIDAVKEWRQLYQIIDGKGKRMYTLESAAQKVGYAKKTLDDYFNQLRYAQQYHFNFNLHANDKIGVLRKFVKECQKKEQMNAGCAMIDESYQHSPHEKDDIQKYLRQENSSDEDFLF